MSSIVYEEGIKHFLTSYFQEEPATFGPFYIGLAKGAASLNPNTTLADVNELVGAGYLRQVVLRSASPAGWRYNCGEVQSPEVVFTNTDVLECWEGIDHAFLLAAQPGYTPSLVLVAAADFADTINVPANGKLKVIFRHRFGTNFTKTTYLNEAVATAGGYATVNASASIVAGGAGDALGLGVADGTAL
jgi:hypothetical protein